LVNAGTALQAAVPAIEVTRLLRLLGVGADLLRAVGGVLLAVSALSVFIALWNAVRERRADLAMLRMLGAPPGRVASLLLCEALWLALLASGMGLLLGHGLAQVLGALLQARAAARTGLDLAARRSRCAAGRRRWPRWRRAAARRAGLPHRRGRLAESALTRPVTHFFNPLPENSP
jgi:ABC-type antimicrobial peptide transport system permease subunit